MKKLIDEVLALAYQKTVESKQLVHQHKIKEAHDTLWKGVILVQGIEFDLLPENKPIIMPLRLALEHLTHPLSDRLRNHFLPNRKLVFSEEWNEFWKQYHKIGKQFMDTFSKLSKG